MQKIIIAFTILAASLFVSCHKQDNLPEPQRLHLNLSINNGADTKARKTDWESGDVVYVFFRIEDTSPIPYLKLTYDGTAWNPSWTPGHEAEIAGTSSGKLVAVYSPVGFPVEELYWLGRLSAYRYSGSDEGVYFLAAESVDYTVTAGTLSATLNMVSYDNWVNFVIKDIPSADVSNWNFACDKMLKSRLGGVDTDFRTFLSNNNYGEAVRGFAYKGEVMFGGPIKGLGTANDYTFTVVNNNGTPENTSDDVTYQATFANKTLKGRNQIVLPDISTWPTI